jgi:hypothetical protein
MSEEKHHHGLFHHKKDEDRPSETVYGSDDAPYSSDTTTYSESTAYSTGGPGAYGSGRPGGYDVETTKVVTGTTESGVDYEKEEKHHKHLEHVGEFGAAAAGAYALVRNYILLFHYHIIPVV